MQKISKCHLPKQHFRNFLSLAKPGELVARMIELKVVWSRKQNFYFGKGPNAKESLNSFNRLKDILKFRTNQLFIEWVVQTIASYKLFTKRRNKEREMLIFNVASLTNLIRAIPCRLFPGGAKA